MASAAIVGAGCGLNQEPEATPDTSAAIAKLDPTAPSSPGSGGGHRVSPATASPAWRCVNSANPNDPQCEDFLINDIETIVTRDWNADPWSWLLSYPPLPYTCSDIAWDEWGNAWTVATTSGEIPWTIYLSTNPQSFLIGGMSASATMTGTVYSLSPSISGVWSNISFTYVYGAGGSNVMAPAGDTGVADIGGFYYWSASDSFRNGSLHISLQLPASTYGWNCQVGPGDLWVGAYSYPGGSSVTLDYPVPWTAVEYVIAEGIRNQFRRAVRLEVTGSP